MCFLIIFVLVVVFVVSVFVLILFVRNCSWRVVMCLMVWWLS